MMNTAVAALALFAASAVADWGFDATAIGKAVVINKCNYPVRLCNVPSANGGYEQQEEMLAPGAEWSQPYTPLSNNNGWSIKLYKPDVSSVLQYEYTTHMDGIIWYDLSCVDGNPWDKDWEITANGTDCSPKQQAYRYSTDDAYGMQSCSQDTTIIVTVCTGVSVDNGDSIDSPKGQSSSSSSVSSAPAYTTFATSTTAVPTTTVPTTTSIPKPTTSSTSTSTSSTSTSRTSTSTTATPTTLSTSTTAAPPETTNVVIVTEYVTVVATATHEVIAPGYYDHSKRHEHGHNHQHQHHA